MDRFMAEAIKEAKKGLAEGGIPIGAVLAKGNRLVSKGHNMRIQENNPIMHAEMKCIENAGRIKSFKGTVLYSTLMPCFMCSGAVVEFCIPKVVVGESSNFSGTRQFLESHNVEVVDLKLEECKKMLASYIKKNKAVWREDIGEL